MKEIQIKQLYDSPRLKVEEIKARQVLCGSNPNGTDEYEREEW